MQKVILEIQYDNNAPLIGGEFEQLCNWLAVCPIPKEQIQVKYE